jgi:hypothetical protein
MPLLRQGQHQQQVRRRSIGVNLWLIYIHSHQCLRLTMLMIFVTCCCACLLRCGRALQLIFIYRAVPWVSESAMTCAPGIAIARLDAWCALVPRFDWMLGVCWPTWISLLSFSLVCKADQLVMLVQTA